MSGWPRCKLPLFCICFGAILQSCAFFPGKPPLPKQASFEQLGRGATEADFAAAVREAEIVYFPQDRISSAARSEPAARLLEAFEQSGTPFAVGWDMVDASQQSLLDELSHKAAEGRERLIARLDLAGSGRAREHCRALLREGPTAGARHLALRCPAALLAKLSEGERLNADEEQLVPHGFTSPVGGLQAYTERMAGMREASDRNPAAAYQAELLQEQFAAELIVQHLRNTNAGAKLLVFAEGTDLQSGRGIPFYVAQKLPVRQLVFGRDDTGARLLTEGRRRQARSFQIVDSAPAAGRD